ncbi:TonB-dependent receptor [Aliiglaciecola sp.]|nr:TonB-dependent receptor [Aliiglaciecola sp.]
MKVFTMLNKTLPFTLSASFLLLSSSLFAQQTNSETAQQEIEKVSVVSSRIVLPTNRLATSTTVLDEFDLQFQTALNVTDVLRQTPSVGVSNSGGLGKNTVLRVRGEEGFRTKLYIDNVELSDTSSPQVAPVFDDVLVDQLSRIEVLRGTQGLSYGADAGGVIALFTQEYTDGFSAAASASISRYDTQALSGNLAFGNETGNIFFSASTLSSDGFNAQTSDTSGELDGYDNQTFHFKGQVNITEQLQGALVVRQADADNEYDGCFDNTTFAPSNDCLTQAQQTTSRVSLSYTHENAKHEVAFNNTEIERRFINNGLFGFENSGSIEKFEYLGSAKWQQHDFIFGAELKEETLEGNTQTRDQNSIFAEWLGQFSHGISANLGVRLDDNDTFGKHNSLRAGLVKLIDYDTIDIKLKSSFGTGFRAPSLFEQAYNDGPFAFGDAANLQLKEENSQGVDVGIELLLGSGSSVEVVLFKQTIEDEIMFDAVGFQGYLQGQGESESQGVEIGAEHVFENGTSFWTNYTYNDATDTAQQQRLRRPKNKFNFGVRHAWLDDTLLVELNHRVVNDAVDIGGQELDDYTVTNISAKWQALENLSFTLGISNLFDSEYQEVVGFNSAQRSVSLSANLKL